MFTVFSSEYLSENSEPIWCVCRGKKVTNVTEQLIVDITSLFPPWFPIRTNHMQTYCIFDTDQEKPVFRVQPVCWSWIWEHFFQTVICCLLKCSRRMSRRSRSGFLVILLFLWTWVVSRGGEKTIHVLTVSDGRRKIFCRFLKLPLFHHTVFFIFFTTTKLQVILVDWKLVFI